MHLDEFRSCFAATFEQAVKVENEKTEDEQAQLEISKVSTKGTVHAKELCGPFRNFDASLTDFDLTVNGSSLRRYPRLMDREEAKECLRGLDFCRIEKRHFEFELASCSL